MGNFMQDSLLATFLLVFIGSETYIPAPYIWGVLLLAIGMAVTMLFRKTGYQVAVSIFVSLPAAAIAFLLGIPFWLSGAMFLFALWRIQERFAKEQEDPTHDGNFMIALTMMFAGVYFLGTVLQKEEAVREAVIVAIAGGILFVLDRMIVQWMHSKGGSKGKLPDVLLIFACIIGLIGLLTTALSLFAANIRTIASDYLGTGILAALYPIGVVVEWLTKMLGNNIKQPNLTEPTPTGVMGNAERETKIRIDGWLAFLEDFPWLALFIVIGSAVLFYAVWRFFKTKPDIATTGNSLAMYDSLEVVNPVSVKDELPIWLYSMETNIVRDAYREFERMADEHGFVREQNETVREWFDRMEWKVSDRFHRIYDEVRYSGGRMNQEDGKWFINEMKKISKKNFQDEV